MARVKVHVTPDKVILLVLLLLLWGLFAVPFILFHIPQAEQQIVANETDNLTENQLEAFSSLNITRAENISCLQDFYFEESKNYCVPDCYSYSTYPQAWSQAIDATIITSSCVATLCILAVLVISCVRRKAMLTYPSVLVFYMSLISLLYYSTILIGYMDRYKLYCISRDMEETLTKPTPYCLLSGIISEYRYLQLLLWWFAHVISIFFMIFHPLRAKTFLASKKVHLVHLAIVTAGLLLPAIPPIITLLADIGDNSNPLRLGYRLVLYPPHVCSNIRTYINFYSVNVPSNILLITGVTFLLLIIWKLYKQRHIVNQHTVSTVSTAEKKVLISFCYFTLLHISDSALAAHFKHAFTELIIEFGLFLLCGRYSTDCEQPDVTQIYHPVGWMADTLVNAGLPIFLLVYVTNCEMLKRKFTRKKDTGYYNSAHASSKAQTTHPV